MTPLIPIFLITVVSGVCCDNHTLQYYITAASEFGQTEFSIVGYIDDVQIMLYRSDVGRDIPVVNWMKKEEEKYWDDQTVISKQLERVFKDMLKKTMERFNQTRGIHYCQWISTCKLKDDNSTSGTTFIRYDGRDFIYLDKEKEFWIYTMDEAELTAKEWNNPESPNTKWGHLQSRYLDSECIHDLKVFLEHGREDLEKRVRPEVKVWGHRQSDDVTRLHCLVYGFHPRPVEVKWVRNGEDHIPSDEMTQILPHPDGTYQIRVSVKVPTSNGDTYSCHVDHSSLEEIMIVNWGE
ncbi:class I histocompatibility antigen, F10 alpha chain-like [Rana temporaria]|uniref:class I histocompatibility antigen, F10 alpha chain-like n=1 Tax=Rana temporaria TaxID=8407 RepID=UPI001AADE2D9|nr:class I histocompatibility antigen, F10 alpha chain-like [Rana temporaria]